MIMKLDSDFGKNNTGVSFCSRQDNEHVFQVHSPEGIDLIELGTPRSKHHWVIKRYWPETVKLKLRIKISKATREEQLNIKPFVTISGCNAEEVFCPKNQGVVILVEGGKEVNLQVYQRPAANEE